MLPPLLAALLLLAPPEVPLELLTVAESSGYRATATHEQVMTLLDRIESRSDILRRGELGRTSEGRAIPLVVVANPPVATAQAARDDERLVLFAFGDIHAGEVCGKEALLMLVRELALQPDHPLLEEIIFVCCPILNGDGNDRMALDNRPGQIGPADGMGQRPNAQGLDLNRDHVKLESPEIRALVRLLTEWDPQVTIDTHTTDGSHHRYVLTYAAPLNPSGHPAPIGFCRDVLLPEVTRRLRDRTGYDTFFYGNFDDEGRAWRTYSAMPRFGGPYRGLRGQLSILSEAYAYATYEDRVLATREFVREIMTFAAERRDELRRLHERAREETARRGLDPAPDDLVGIRHEIAAFKEPAVIRGFETTDGAGGAPPAGAAPVDRTVVHMGRFEPILSVRRPHGYVIGPGHPLVVETLRRHGIVVETAPDEVTLEIYTVTAIDRSPRAFQGHHTIRVEVEPRTERRPIAPGSLLVPTGQPLGTLAVYLLEPSSEDGLATWNFFDDDLAVGAEFPVARVIAPPDPTARPASP